MDCFDLQQKKKEKNDESPHPIAMKQSRKVVGGRSAWLIEDFGAHIHVHLKESVN